jgi:hypothetical protein
MKAHVAKPTQGIKMPEYKVRPAKPMPKQKVAVPRPSKPSGKSTEPLKLPTISLHRERLADLGTTPAKKGKSS